MLESPSIEYGAVRAAILEEGVRFVPAWLEGRAGESDIVGGVQGLMGRWGVRTGRAEGEGLG